MTILSVNKTRKPMGALRSFFIDHGRIASVFLLTPQQNDKLLFSLRKVISNSE